VSICIGLHVTKRRYLMLHSDNRVVVVGVGTQNLSAVTARKNDGGGREGCRGER
jgi:hypothetical protein